MRKSYERKSSPDRKPFRQVANSMLIPIVEFDRKFILLYANPPALELLQLSDETHASEITAADLVASEQISLVEDGLNSLRNGEPSVSISLRVVRGDGLRIPTQAYTNPIVENGKPLPAIALAVYTTSVPELEKICLQSWYWSLTTFHPSATPESVTPIINVPPDGIDRATREFRLPISSPREKEERWSSS